MTIAENSYSVNQNSRADLLGWEELQAQVIILCVHPYKLYAHCK